VSGVFVLGGTGGLGRAICLGFARAGVPVAFSWHSNANASANLREAISAHGVAAHDVRLDARDGTATTGAVDDAAAALGGLHGVIYAGGPPFTPQFFGRTDAATWREWLDGDVMAAINLAQAGLPHLRATNGAFVAISSYQGAMIEVRGGVSAICKAAIDRMIAVIAKEEGRYGVRANAVRCGWIESPTNDRLFAAMPELRESKAKSIPLGRLGRGDDVAEVVLFLCSAAASYVTGNILTLDGGESL